MVVVVVVVVVVGSVLTVVVLFVVVGVVDTVGHPVNSVVVLTLKIQSSQVIEEINTQRRDKSKKNQVIYS